VRPFPAWLLVADGGKARIYRTTGDGDSLRVRLEPVPGGTFSRPDSGQFGPRPGHTPHDAQKRRAEEEFLSAVLAWIEKPEHLAAFAFLIIAVPPRTLGEIRFALSPELAERIHGEIRGDLTKLPMTELERRISPYIPGIGSERKRAS
jgi:protein required for attachment to host cells